MRVKVENRPRFKDKYGKSSRYDKEKDYDKWNANVGRRDRINSFRKSVNLDESVEITEDVINKHKNMFNHTCIDYGVDPKRLKAELLGQKYTGLEDDDF